jgi:hypothetical protein
MVVGDIGQVVQEDLAVTHLIRHSEVGLPRASVLVSRLRSMNPLVSISESTSLQQAGAEGITVAIVTPLSLAELRAAVHTKQTSSDRLVVAIVQIGTSTFGLFVTGGTDFDKDVVQALLGQGALRGKPRALQLAALRLHCGDPTLSFECMLRRILTLRAELAADAIDDDAVQLLLDTLFAAGDRVAPSAIDATIGGGVCAQRVINIIGEGTTGGLQWFALETSGRIECIVGP